MHDLDVAGSLWGLCYIPLFKEELDPIIFGADIYSSICPQKKSTVPPWITSHLEQITRAYKAPHASTNRGRTCLNPSSMNLLGMKMDRTPDTLNLHAPEKPKLTANLFGPRQIPFDCLQSTEAAK